MIRNTLVALFAVAIGTLIYVTRIAPRWLRVSRLRVRVPHLPDEWRGVRISHLSDFHVGAPGLPLDHLHRARGVALAFEPDIIALTGDYYEAGSDVPSEGLYRDWPDGALVFGVMGNHDRRGRPGTLQRIKDELRAGGVDILDNEARQVCLRGRQAWVAGVDDAHTYNADVERALSMVPEDETVLLLLAHHPDAIRHLPVGRVRLQLSGHTHGGQVRLLPSGELPFVDLIRKLRDLPPRPDGPVYRRWHWMKGTVLLISDGLGVSSLPMRFRTRPHLILIELDRAEAHAPEPCDDVDRYVEEIDPEPWLIRWAT